MESHPQTVPVHVADADKTLDTISLRNLHLVAILGPDAWARPGKPQPIQISLQIGIDTTSAGVSDDITHTFSYGQIAKDVTAKLDGKDFMSIDHLTSELASLAENWPGEVLKIEVLAPKALLRVEGGFGRELVLKRKALKENVMDGSEQLIWHVANHEWFVKDLRIACIIGVNPHERLEKQSVVVNLRMQGEADTAAYTKQIKEGPEMWRRLVRRVCEVVEPSDFQTLEALTAEIARRVLQGFPAPRVTVGVEKPSALTFVEGAGVEILRDRTSVGLG